MFIDCHCRLHQLDVGASYLTSFTMASRWGGLWCLASFHESRPIQRRCQASTDEFCFGHINQKLAPHCSRGSSRKQFSSVFLNLEASWKCVLQEFVSLFVFIIQCNVFAICFTLATVLVCLPACSWTIITVPYHLRLCGSKPFTWRHWKTLSPAVWKRFWANSSPIKNSHMYLPSVKFKNPRCITLLCVHCSRLSTQYNQKHCPTVLCPPTNTNNTIPCDPCKKLLRKLLVWPRKHF